MNVCMNDDAGDDSGVAAIVVVSIAGSVKVYEPCDASRPCRHGKHLQHRGRIMHANTVN